MPPRLWVPNRSPSTAFKHILTTGGTQSGVRTYATKPTMEPSFSKGAGDVDALRARLDPLLSTGGGRWTLANGGEALERTFRFKTFAKTWVSLGTNLFWFILTRRGGGHFFRFGSLSRAVTQPSLLPLRIAPVQSPPSCVDPGHLPVPSKLEGMGRHGGKRQTLAYVTAILTPISSDPPAMLCHRRPHWVTDISLV